MEMKKSSARKPETGAFMKLLFILLVLCSIIPQSIDAKDVVLAIRQEGKDFEDAFRGLSEELRADFDMKEIVVNKKSAVDAIIDPIKTIKPKLIVLMDNASIALYRKYQSSLPAEETPIPSVALMGVMIKDAIADLKNAAGISYEIPIVTSIVSLRSVLGLPMKKVGVVHREFLKDFLGENTTFCKREGIEIASVALPNKSESFKTLLKKALETLVQQKIEAIWIPNDNALLQPDIIQNVWIPAVRKYKLPVVVGVEILVTPKINLGTFAVLPDHVALGTQAAEMVFEIMDNDWVVEEKRVDPPLAVYKIINLTQAKKNFNVSDEKLKAVDKKLK